jgi:hypothetical protein
MLSTENNIRLTIFFSCEAEGLDIEALDTSLPAPTVYTGRKLRGNLFLSHDMVIGHIFDTVQLILKGITLT